MTMIDPMQFAQLLASRICHDLISPVAAVNNGIELLLEDDDDDIESRKRALELVEDSANITALKLKLMRATFGAGQSLPENNTPTDLLMLCQPIAEKNKIQILWDHPDDCTLNRTQGQVMLNLILILLEGLPRGGMIELTQQKNQMECVVQSQKLIFSDQKIAYLTQTQPVPIEPRYIGFTILHLLSPTTKYTTNKKENYLNIKFNI